MWIRSQDKRQLIKANKLFVKFGTITCVDSTWDDYVIGEYSTEEKAMKVLDMICDAIVSYESSKTEDVGVFTMIFEMPSDEEVE